MLYISSNIDLDQYDIVDLNQEISTSPMHMTPINSGEKVMDTTLSMITA